MLKIKMHSFLVVKILDSQSVALPSTLIYGSVELRSHKSDLEEELSTLKESAKSHNLEFEKYAFCARIGIITICQNKSDALNIADNKFSEVLDLKSIEYSISNIQTSNIGYIKDLETGEIEPIYKTEYSSAMAFVVHQEDIQRFNALNFIISLNCDLSNRYLRSLHWSRNAKHEKNKQLKILFYWFSVEALLKESETDNISWAIRWFLGFPNGKHRQEVSISLLNRLSNHSSYSFWNNKLIDIVDRIRIFRNDSVHSGFRNSDFSKEDIKLYSDIMVYSTTRCQAAVQVALINKLTTVSDFKEYVAVIFEKEKRLVNDIHGNIIFNLDRAIRT